MLVQSLKHTLKTHPTVRAPVHSMASAKRDMQLPSSAIKNLTELLMVQDQEC